ncbi:hypothetical protein BgiBS90_019031, partial [Biomphalaria glabrata]
APVQFYASQQHDHNEWEVEFVCSISGFPKKIQIINRCEETIVLEKTFNPKNYKRTLELKYAKNNIKYFHSIPTIGSYECRIFYFQNEIASTFLDIHFDK